MLVAPDPMSRTMPATSTSMTAIIIAYSATSWPSCCDHNLCVIKHQFPLYLRLVQWLVRGSHGGTECGCYSKGKCPEDLPTYTHLGHYARHHHLHHALDEVGAFASRALRLKNTFVTLTVLAAIVMLLISAKIAEASEEQPSAAHPRAQS